MDKYFENNDLLQHTLLPYLSDEYPLNSVNKIFHRLNYEKYNTHIQPHCLLETYYKDTKTIQKRKKYKNRKEHGLCEEWYKNDKIWKRYDCKNNKLDGLSEQWYPNGQLFCRCIYSNGKLNGLYYEWFINGKQTYQFYYENGKMFW